MIVLVLGGARSGKSELAERRAASLTTGGAIGTVTYLATALDRGDDDLARRIAAHKERRPASWQTLEAGTDLVGSLQAAAAGDVVLVDSLGTWVATQLDSGVDTDAVLAALRGRGAPVVIVSDEVGLGVHPSSEEGRRFRDALGELNRAVADIADEVVLVVAGRVLPLDRA